MKKIIALSMCILMLICLCSCGKGNDEKQLTLDEVSELFKSDLATTAPTTFASEANKLGGKFRLKDTDKLGDWTHSNTNGYTLDNETSTLMLFGTKDEISQITVYDRSITDDPSRIAKYIFIYQMLVGTYGAASSTSLDKEMNPTGDNSVKAEEFNQLLTDNDASHSYYCEWELDSCTVSLIFLKGAYTIISAMLK